MKEKFSLLDIINMFYTQRRQSEIAQVTPGTWATACNNPHWPAFTKHLNTIKLELYREIDHSISSTSYPEHRQWLRAMKKYLKTLEDINDV